MIFDKYDKSRRYLTLMTDYTMSVAKPTVFEFVNPKKALPSTIKGLCRVRVDPTRLQQMMLQLLGPIGIFQRKFSVYKSHARKGNKSLGSNLQVVIRCYYCWSSLIALRNSLQSEGRWHFKQLIKHSNLNEPRHAKISLQTWVVIQKEEWCAGHAHLAKYGYSRNEALLPIQV